MNDSPMDAVRQRWEREAEGFDAIYRLERSPFWRWFNTTFRKAIFERYDLAFANAGDVTGKAILDIGCGSGVYAVDFARRGAAHVLGIDLSNAMLQIARSEAESHNVQDICTFRQGDFLTMDIPDKYDVSIAMGVFDYLPDPQTFLNKMAAVTTGPAIASFPGHSLVRERARRLRYRLGNKGNVFFYSLEDVQRLADNAGLRNSRIIPIHSSGTGFVLVGLR